MSGTPSLPYTLMTPVRYNHNSARILSISGVNALYRRREVKSVFNKICYENYNFQDLELDMEGLSNDKEHYAVRNIYCESL